MTKLTDAPQELIRRVKTYAGPAALKGLTPIVLEVRLQDGFDPNASTSLSERSVVIAPVPNPMWAAQMDVSGAKRRGLFTWTASLAENATRDPYRALLDASHEGTVAPHSRAFNNRGPVDLAKPAREGKNQDTYRFWQPIRNEQRATHFWASAGSLVHSRYPNVSPYKYGVITVDAAASGLFIRVHTHFIDPPEDLGVEVDLNVHPAGGQRIEPKAIRGADAVLVTDWARNVGLPVVDASGGTEIAALMEATSRKVTVWPFPGQPARAMVAIGRETTGVAHDAFDVADSDRLVTVRPVSAAPLQDALGQLVGDDTEVVLHPRVQDVAQMASAEPHNDERLRPYQREMVALHLATRYGAVNAMEPGLGKTVTTLVAMDVRAEAKRAAGQRYFGLIASEANTRAQWAGEISTWTTDVRKVVVDTARKVDDLVEALEDNEDERPLFVVTSHSLVSRIEDALGDDVDEPDPLGQALVSVHWDDIVADEATGLKSTGSKFTRAMWRLRDHADIALALTGTPISKSLDELGRLIAWTRDDRDMFHGVRLSKQFQMTSETDRSGFQDAVGTVVFRRDKSEIKDELPEIETTVEFLEPSFEERKLSEAAVKGLREQYDEFVAQMERVDELAGDEHSELVAQVKERLREARNAVNTSREMARKATSDPASLLESNSTAAKILHRYIERANEKPGTKRTWAVNYATERVAEGDQVLLFTVFAQTAKGLIHDLREAGLRVGEVLGGGGKKRDRYIAEFSEQELDVLVCTSAGERGLNLQMAGVVIHYDLPWTPDSIVQRTGRVERIGASAEEIKVVFPVMVNTIEERVAALVVSRAALAMQALDASRGIDVSNTNAGRALAGLTEHIDLDELDETGASLVEMTRMVLENLPAGDDTE